MQNGLLFDGHGGMSPKINMLIEVVVCYAECQMFMAIDKVFLSAKKVQIIINISKIDENEIFCFGGFGAWFSIMPEGLRECQCWH